jgi:hypothetical protein
MKKIISLKKICAATCCMLAGVFVLAGVPHGVFNASAGVSENVISNPEDLEGATSLPNYWNASNDKKGISVADGVVTFSESRQSPQIVLRNAANNLSDVGAKEYFTLSAKVELVDVSEAFRFGISFNLPSMRSTIGTEGSIFLWFGKVDGTTSYGLTDYSEGQTELIPATPLGISGQFCVDMTVSTDGKLQVKFDGNTICQDLAVRVPSQGYVGFGRTTTDSVNEDSVSTVELSEVYVRTYTSVTPSNANYLETFAYNNFNMNMFSMMSRGGGMVGSRLAIEDEELKFVNTGEAFFGTKKQYSNVEVSFELTHLQRAPEYDGDGNLIRTVSSSFGMIFGALNSTSVSYDPDFIVEFIPVGGSAIKPAEGTKIVVKSTRAILHEQTLPEKYDLFKVDDQFGVKFEMIDGTISVSLKRSNEFGFTKVMEYGYGITPTGFVQLAASGAMNGSFSSGLDCASVRTGNFSVDNFSVLNRDVHGVVETVSYLGNRLSIPEDYTDYENTWSDDDLLG